MTTKCANLCFYQFVVFIVILSLLSGCVHPKNVQISLPIPVEETEKIPLRAGLYLDKQFTNYSITYLAVINVGEALSKGAENIINKAFQEGVTIYTTDLTMIPKGLDVLVIPEIDRIYVYEHGLGSYWSNTSVIARIKWRIQDMNGKIVFMNTFTGEDMYKRPANIYSMSSRACKGAAKALENHFTKAFVGLTSIKWWELIKKETN